MRRFAALSAALLAALALAWACAGKKEPTKTEIARGQLENIRAALGLYQAQRGGIPTEKEGLRAVVERTPYLAPPDIVDPWGNEFIYRIDVGPEISFARDYKVFVYSAGPDGMADTLDDVAPEEPEA